MKCKICSKNTRLPSHQFCSQKCYWKSLKSLTGEKSPNYRKVVGKTQVHKWLDVHYGQPKICEGKDCRKNATWYDWALKKGKKYERNRNNFLRLCRSCHRRYDLTPEKILQLIALGRLGGSKTSEKKKLAASLRERKRRLNGNIAMKGIVDFQTTQISWEAKDLILSDIQSLLQPKRSVKDHPLLNNEDK